MKNNKGQTAKDILEINKSFLELYDYYKLTYILSEPTGCKLLRMTRPIEKVERRSTLQICVLIFDVLNFALFLFLAFIGISTQSLKSELFKASFLNFSVLPKMYV